MLSHRNTQITISVKEVGRRITSPDDCATAKQPAGLQRFQGWQGALFLIEELDISRPTLKCKLSWYFLASN